MSTGEAFLPILESYWVIPGRFRAGEYPGSMKDDDARNKLCWLLEQSTNLIIDLTEPGEASLRPYAHIFYQEATKIPQTVIYKRMPLKDFNTPPKAVVREILDTIDFALGDGKNIYLHCYGGKGRTGTVVGCFLVRHGMAGIEALEKILEFRKDLPGRDEQSPETEGQIRMVLEWKKGQ